MNTNDFEAFMYILWLLIIGYFKNVSISCVFTYFIFLSESEWNSLFYFSLPIVFWSVVLKN